MKLQDTYEILAKHEVSLENNHALTQSLLRREDVFDYLSKNDKEG